MLISDRLSVSANIGKVTSVNRNIGKISYRCIATNNNPQSEEMFVEEGCDTAPPQKDVNAQPNNVLPGKVVLEHDKTLSNIGTCITLRGRIKVKSRDTNLMYP